MICTQWDAMEEDDRNRAIGQRRGWLALPGTLSTEFGSLDTGSAERTPGASNGKWMKESTIVDEDTERNAVDGEGAF